MSDEKDRLGEKLRDKERGEEERYFAELEKKKIERLREKRRREGRPLGDCPRCGEGLTARDHMGVTVDECPSCGGIWLDRGELEVLQERASEPWMTKWIRSVLEGGS